MKFRDDKHTYEVLKHDLVKKTYDVRRDDGVERTVQASTVEAMKREGRLEVLL